MPELEVTTDEVIDSVNDFSDFSDVDISDIDDAVEEVIEKEDKKEEVKEESKELKLDKSSEESKELNLKEEKEEEGKLIEGVSGEEAVKFKPDTIFKHKVDGEEVSVTMQELLNDYSGKQSYDKKFGELSTDKHQFNIDKNSFEMEKQQVIEPVNNFVKAITDGDGARAIEHLAEISGANPVDLREHFLNLMMGSAMEYSKATPEERKVLDNEYKIKYLEERNQVRDDNVDLSSQQSEMETNVLKFQVKYKLSDTELVKLHDDYFEATSDQDRSLEALEEFHNSNLTQGNASSILENIDPSLKGNESYIAEISEFISSNPDLSNEDVIESVREALNGVKAAENPSDDKQANSTTTKLKNRVTKNNSNKSQTVLGDVTTEDVDDVVDFDEVTHTF